MPLTLLVIIPICESGMPGSIGAVAMMVTVPVKVVHWAIPFGLMETPAGTGMAEKGLPIDQSTCGMPDMGAMVYAPVAVN